MEKIKAYKLAKPDGWDFYTGHTINYRGNIGKTVKCPNVSDHPKLCTDTVIHASVNPNDCFIGARIPCSAYEVKGSPVCGDEEKYGFTELHIIREITDLDTLFGWRYSEAAKPFNPLCKKQLVKPEHVALLKKWASVWDSVRASVRASVGDSVRASVWDSVRASVRAYIGSLFPNIAQWKYINHKAGEYPFQSAVDLWRAGFVPSFDGKTWRLHTGKDAKVVYEWTPEKKED
jgi:hypothetical protein